jgi:predicted nucleic acid-binding protein
VRDAVLDSSVVLKWLDPTEERHRAPAQALARAYEDGRLRVTAPRFLLLELMNVLGRRLRRDGDDLAGLAAVLGALRFDLVEPPLADVARWTSRGLTAYDAAYVAVAEAAGLEVITDDREMVDLAPEIARSLAEAAA